MLNFLYDANGNQVHDQNSTSSADEHYDDEDRLTYWSNNAGKTDTFFYNGLGMRVDREDTTGSHSFVADGSSPGASVLFDNFDTAVYTAGLSETRNGVSKYYHADTLGSTRGLTDAGQNPTDSLLFDAFGVQQYRSGTTPTPYGFAGADGYQRDVDSGLILCGHRYYNPATGRFLSSDPAGAGDNWYAYCDNDPLNAVDPLLGAGGLIHCESDKYHLIRPLGYR